MSISSELTRITNARDTIRAKMVAAGQATSSDTLGTLANALSIGTDTTDATATANDLIYPKTAYVNGVKITGSKPMATQYDILNIISGR